MNGERLSTFVGQPDRPLIIGGRPRSGTTLLRTMLQTGPEVAIPRETRFVLEAQRERRRFGDLRDARMSAIHEPVSDGVAALAELLRGFTRQRRRYAAAQLKLASKERLQKVVGHRYPLSEIRN
jgi:hypothetical protein